MAVALKQHKYASLISYQIVFCSCSKEGTHYKNLAFGSSHKPFVMSCDISVFSANLTYSLSPSYKLMQAAADKVRNLDI
jgi:hypothetical protein